MMRKKNNLNQAILSFPNSREQSTEIRMAPFANFQKPKQNKSKNNKY